MSSSGSRRWPPAWWWLLAAVAALPIAAAGLHSLRSGWYPESDDATITLLAGDTFSAHPPTLGMVSTGGATLEDPELHHPGPLEMYLLAPARTVLGPAFGNTLTVVLVNLAAMVGLGLALRSVGGDRLGTGGLLAGALTLWGLGGEVPGSVWNPYVVALPFACFVGLVIAVCAGRRRALPWALGVGTFVAQTHLSYVGLVGLLAAVALAVTFARRREPGSPLPVVAAKTVAVLAVLWAVPVGQQILGRPGNLGQIVRAALGGDGEVVGRRGLGELGRVVGVPLVGLSPEGDLVRVLPDLSLGSLALVLVPWVLTLALAVAAWRRRDHVTVGALAAVATTLAGAAFTSTRIPLADGVQYQYYGLWMWPIAALTWTVLGWAAWRTLPARRAAPLRDQAARVPTMAAAALALVVLSMIAALPRPGAWEPWAAYRRIAGDLAREMDLSGQPRVLVRFRGGTAYLSTGSALALAAEAEGGRTYIDPGVPTEVFPWGEHRRYRGEPIDIELWVVSGPAPADLPAGAQATATTAALTPTEDRDRQAIHRRLLAAVERDGLAAGPREPGNGDAQAAVAQARADPVAALQSGRLAELASRGLIEPPGGDLQALVTDARLEAMADEGSVAYYVVVRPDHTPSVPMG